MPRVATEADAGGPRKGAAGITFTPLAGLSRGGLSAELLAGVSLIAISIPLNIGYAQIAGLPPTAGLYALVLPTLVYALLISSRQLVVSPDATGSAVVFSSLLALGVSGGDLATYAAAQAILTGVFLTAAGLLRLGFLATFLSHPILIGFLAGLATEILVSQAAKMLGLNTSSDDGFFVELIRLVTELPQTNPWALAISALSLAVLILGARWLPIVPWAMVVLVGTTVASVTLDLPSRGVAVLGTVPPGPPVFAFPMLGLGSWLTLVPSAIALAMVTTAEGLLVSRAYAERNGYPNNPNQNLVAIGAGNLAAGCSSSFAVGASAPRTAAMDQAGSRTQLPALILAAGTLLLLLFGTELLADIPIPAIGAVVAVAVWRLLAIDEFRELWGESRWEFGVSAACVLGVLVVGSLGGLLLAFVLALVNLVQRASNPPIELLAQATPQLIGGAPQHQAEKDAEQRETDVLVIRFGAALFFANADRLRDETVAQVERAPVPVRAVVLDLSAVSDIDVTGAGSLRQLRAWLAERGILLAYSHAHQAVTELLAHYHLLEGVGQYPTNHEAIAGVDAVVDSDLDGSASH